MELKIKGGSKNINMKVVTGEYAGLVKSIPTKPIRRKEIEEVVEKENLTNAVNEPEEKRVNKISLNVEVKEVKELENKEPEHKEEKKEVICPIEFDESLIKHDNEDNITEPAITIIEKFNILLEDVLKILEEASEEEKEEMNNDITKAFKEQIQKAIESYLENTCKEDNEDEEEDETDPSYILARSKKLFKLADSELTANEVDLFIDNIPSSIIDLIIDKAAKSGKLKLNNYIESDKDGNIIYAGFKFVAAELINVKDICQEMDQSKIIVIVDDNGNYLTNGKGEIIAIDIIDDKSVDSLSIVSSAWLNSAIDKNKSEEEPLDNKSETIPTGVLPPSMSVNGVPVEEEGE